MLKVPFSPPDITEQEIQEVVEALKSGWITTGPRTKEFEKQIASFVHAPRAVCLNSATACAELALHFLGIGPGDEVITSAYTYTASASIVCHVGAKLVLVDTAPDSYEMDYDKLEEAITEKTKVIILDDAAHAFGATRNGKACGEVADFTSFSFHAVKNLTTAEGGALTWKEIPGIDNDWIYSQFMLLSLHGQNKDALAKTKLGAWEYDIVMPAYKCNMTDIMAGIGLAQLKRYPGILERRRVIVERYQERLKELPVEFLIHDGITCDGTEHGKAKNGGAKNGGAVCHEMVHDEKKPGGNEFHSSRHLCLVRLRGKDLAFRNQLIIDMAEAGVAANVHYKPLPMHTAYIKMGFDMKDYTNAYKQFENEITLPLHTCLTDEQVEYVAETFINCYGALEASLGSNTSMLEGR